MPDAAGSARILSQVVNAFQGVRKGFQENLTRMYKDIQKTSNEGPMAGVSRRYTRRYEDGAQLPEEYREVQYTAESKLGEFLDKWVALVDVSATLDQANTVAKASVRVGDTVLVENAPAPQLLSLEKRLQDLRAFVATLPTLDPAKTWSWNQDAGAYAARPSSTTKTQRVTFPVVMAPATDRHPAQVVAEQRDDIIGTWETIQFSGHMDGNAQKRLLDRLDTVILAVQYAREEANASTSVEAVKLGSSIRTYVLGE